MSKTPTQYRDERYAKFRVLEPADRMLYRTAPGDDKAERQNEWPDFMKRFTNESRVASDRQAAAKLAARKDAYAKSEEGQAAVSRESKLREITKMLEKGHANSPVDMRRAIGPAAEAILLQQEVNERDARIASLEKHINDLHNPPVLVQALADKQAYIKEILADDKETWRNYAHVDYATSLGRFKADVALAEGEWPPGDEWQPEAYLRRQFGLSADGNCLDLNHDSNKGLPKPVIYDIKLEQEQPAAADSFADTFIGRLAANKAGG
jgi:hypothetical protein